LLSRKIFINWSAGIPARKARSSDGCERASFVIYFQTGFLANPDSFSLALNEGRAGMPALQILRFDYCASI